MEPSINFLFRTKQYSARYTVCKRAFPVYIYITLLDEALIKEFGEEIVMHSKDDELLVDHVFTAHRYELYTSIFKSVAAAEQLANDELKSSAIDEEN